jgi:FtsZ-interacting cell division protein ZipA
MFKFFLIIGVIGIITSGIFMGVWTNGQQQRANFHSETEEHRNVRTKISMYSGVIGVISLGISAIIYFF